MKTNYPDSSHGGTKVGIRPKTTKTQARAIYDEFHGVLRCLNGGTGEENERNAPRCYERLREVAKQAEEATRNPGKLLLADSWLWGALNALPDRCKEFGERYGLIDKPVDEERAKAPTKPKIAHTPGPWKAGVHSSHGKPDGAVVWAGSDEYHIARLHASPMGRTVSEQIANARLIVAAPELLGALRALLAIVEEGDALGIPVCGDVKARADMKTAREAIAKAEAAQ